MANNEPEVINYLGSEYRDSHDYFVWIDLYQIAGEESVWIGVSGGEYQRYADVELPELEAIKLYNALGKYLKGRAQA